MMCFICLLRSTCFTLQVLPGSSEPADVRAALKKALPVAPAAAKQVVLDPSLLHITVARLLAPANPPTHGSLAASSARQVRS
jgi:hypothetical protein